MINSSKPLCFGLVAVFVSVLASAAPLAWADGGIVTLPNGGAYQVSLGAALDSATGNIYVSGFSGSSTTLAGSVLANGDLNASFRGGVVLTPVASIVSNYSGKDASNACAVQPDGKLISAGWYVEGKPTSRTYGFALVRYNANGTLDKTFNKSGIVKTSFGTKVARINTVALQSDGKIVVAGRYENPSRCVVLARYTAGGALDSTFGSGGKVITTISGEAMGLAIHGNGIVVGTDTADGMAVIRFTASGALDTAFGTGGVARFSVPDPTPGTYTDLYAIAVDPSDKGIIAAGQFSDGMSYHLTLARFTATGTLDLTFGDAAGYITFQPTQGNYAAEAVAVTVGGKIVVAGSASGASTKLLVARFDTFGNPDPEFNSVGYADGFPGAAHSVLIQSNGSIVAAGAIVDQRSSPQTSTIVIVRYLPDGTPDPNF